MDMDKLPLCVDLDGTLSKSDTLHELLLLALKTKPWVLIKCLFWVFESKSIFKSKLSQEIELNPASLVYNQSIINYIQKERGSREVYLVTGSHQKTALSVSEHLGFFDGVLATDHEINLTGLQKRNALCARFGNNQYEYIGNESKDYSVWETAGLVSAVSSNEDFIKGVRSKYPEANVFREKSASLKDYLKAIRLHHWSKNALIFVPLLLDHRVFDFDAFILLIIAFLSFSMLASASYILNDLLDLHADRANPYKAKRAFASCLIPIQQAVYLMFGIVGCSIFLAAFLPLGFSLMAGIYALVTLCYSFKFKKVAIFDVCILASLFTSRVIAGAFAIGSGLSFWLLAFSMFFFLSLAIAKRVSELSNIAQRNGDVAAIGRGYSVQDIPVLMSSGIASGYISILVVSLYINSENVTANYVYPEVLWLICPLLMYWIGRIWLKTGRGEMSEDPIVFALRDSVSLKAFTLISLIVLIASLIG